MKETSANKARSRKAQPKSAPSKKAARKSAGGKTYIELKQEIASTEQQLTSVLAALNAEADAALKREKAGVIDQINVAIAEFGLRPQDLNFKQVSSRAGKKAAKPVGKKAARKKAAGTEPVAKKPTAKKSSVIKYQDGEGNKWSGRGPKPKWVKDALAAGKQLEELKSA